MMTSDGLLDAQTQNVSRGGAHIRCAATPNLSGGFRLVMTAKERLILVTANVVWSQSLNGNPWSHEMGIRFTTVCKDDLLFLQSVISTQL